MTRAYLSLFRGNLNEAFFYHPLFPIVPLILSIVLFRGSKTVNNLFSSNKFWISILFLFIGVWVVRLFLYFPDVRPMDFNNNSFAALSFKIIKGCFF